MRGDVKTPPLLSSTEILHLLNRGYLRNARTFAGFASASAGTRRASSTFKIHCNLRFKPAKHFSIVFVFRNNQHIFHLPSFQRSKTKNISENLLQCRYAPFRKFSRKSQNFKFCAFPIKRLQNLLNCV